MCISISISIMICIYNIYERICVPLRILLQILLRSSYWLTTFLVCKSSSCVYLAESSANLLTKEPEFWSGKPSNKFHLLHSHITWPFLSSRNMLVLFI